jgi:hypothetical protein
MLSQSVERPVHEIPGHQFVEVARYQREPHPLGVQASFN